MVEIKINEEVQGTSSSQVNFLRTRAYLVSTLTDNSDSEHLISGSSESDIMFQLPYRKSEFKN